MHNILRTCVVVTALLIVLQPSYFLAQQSQVKQGQVKQSETNTGKSVAITFDDLPFVKIDKLDPTQLKKRVQRVIHALNKYNLQVVGFVNESELYRSNRIDPVRKSILLDWIEAGMELGNHTFSHQSLNRVSINTFEKEITRGEVISRAIAEKHSQPYRYFRFPYLHVGADLRTRQTITTFLHERGYSVAPVTINNSDWIYSLAYERTLGMKGNAKQQRVINSYLDHLDASFEYAEKLAYQLFGSPISHVLVLHLNTLNSDYIEEVLSRIKQRGYRFISLDKALQHPAYATPDNYAGPNNDSWLHHWAIEAGLRPDKAPGPSKFIRGLAGPEGYKKYN